MQNKIPVSNDMSETNVGEEETDDIECFPLHAICCVKDISVDTVKKIVSKNPNAVQQRDQNSSLPIHHASENGNLDSLRLIYESYEDGIKEYDGEGR